MSLHMYRPPIIICGFTAFVKKSFVYLASYFLENTINKVL